MKAGKRISARRLRELLLYDPLTGTFTWRVDHGKTIRAGQPAGTVEKKGHRAIVIDYRKYTAGRLAWMYMRSCWPAGIVRARNGDLLDTRWRNLQVRSARQMQENQSRAQKNSKTGVLGVCPTREGKYRAQIRAQGRDYHLGTYGTIEAASAAYQEAKKLLHRS